MGSILEPSVIQSTTDEEKNYLVKENYLSEFETDDEKSVVRANLGVYAKDTVYTQDEAELMVNEKIHSALEGYVSNDELPKALEELSDEITAAGYVKSDGSVPFTSPQTQSSVPTESYHLANKIYVDNSLLSHENAYDPHGTIERVNVILADYAKLADTYTSSELYTQKETDTMLKDYVKRDGSVSFTNPQIGVDPELPSHLSTMRYVNLVMQNHKSEEDPHDMYATLKKYLSNYYTKSETYTKAQTYSRTQLLDIIKSEMGDVVDQAIATHEAEDGSVSDLREWTMKQLETCIKADGSVTHVEPQAGVAAVRDDQFVTKGQVTEIAEDLTAAVEKINKDFVWVTSGPVQTTVGFVEDNAELPTSMTLQEVCDAIFYGGTVHLVAPAYSIYGESICITMTVYRLGTLEYVDIYKNDEWIGSVNPEDFVATSNGGYSYTYCDDSTVTEDIHWRVEFHYPYDETLEKTATTLLSYPVFVGAMPYWWNGQEDVTMDSLQKLIDEDPTNNKFVSGYGPDIKYIEMAYNFSDARKKSLIVVVPYEYPDLTTIVTAAQTLGEDAFAKWVQPMYPAGEEKSVLYKIYVFNQALVMLDETVKYLFN